MRLALSLLVAAALAGCTQAAVTAPPPSTGEPMPPHATFDACMHHEGFFYVPLEDAQALLPAPLEAAAYQGGTLGGFFVSAVACEDVRALDSALPTASFVWAGIGVSAPAGWENEDLFFHGFLLASRQSDEVLTEAFTQLRQQGAAVGDITLATEPTPAGAASGLMDADGVRLLTQVGPDEADGFEDVHARFYSVEDGAVGGAMDLLIATHGLAIGSAELAAPAGVFGVDVPPVLGSIGYHGPLTDMRLAWAGSPEANLATP